MGKIDKAVKTAINIANDNSHGYDQTHRNGPDYDCSSFIAYCLNKAGFQVSLSSWTGNLRKQLLACGFKSIHVNSTRKRGDIFLTEGKHVVMCTSAHEIVHASINEFGKTIGGKTGDQNGKEICERTFYTPDYGWDYHLRYNGDKGSAGYTMNLLKKGSSNIDVTVFEILMTKLGYYSGSIDTKYGAGCVRACENFQTDYNLTVDGQCGKNTWNKLFSLGIR